MGRKGWEGVFDEAPPMERGLKGRGGKVELLEGLCRAAMEAVGERNMKMHTSLKSILSFYERSQNNRLFLYPISYYQFTVSIHLE